MKELFHFDVVALYLDARKTLERCECGVTITDTGFAVVPDGVGDPVHTTSDVNELLIFAQGVAMGKELTNPEE